MVTSSVMVVVFVVVDIVVDEDGVMLDDELSVLVVISLEMEDVILAVLDASPAMVQPAGHKHKIIGTFNE